MSKAIEPKDADGAAPEDADASASRLAVKNYITPQGFAALKAEYDHLHGSERPRVVDIVSWAASNGDRSENGDYLYGKKRLREIDRRLRFLAKRMQAAHIVDPANQPNKTQVFFGASVTYVDDKDQERSVRIVGVDEMDSLNGRISWVSPIAKALLKARVGDVVYVQTPAGLQELEVLAIDYGSIEFK